MGRSWEFYHLWTCPVLSLPMAVAPAWTLVPVQVLRHPTTLCPLLIDTPQSCHYRNKVCLFITFSVPPLPRDWSETPHWVFHDLVLAPLCDLIFGSYTPLPSPAQPCPTCPPSLTLLWSPPACWSFCRESLPPSSSSKAQLTPPGQVSPVPCILSLPLLTTRPSFSLCCL